MTSMIHSSPGLSHLLRDPTHASRVLGAASENDSENCYNHFLQKRLKVYQKFKIVSWKKENCRILNYLNLGMVWIKNGDLLKSRRFPSRNYELIPTCLVSSVRPTDRTHHNENQLIRHSEAKFQYRRSCWQLNPGGGLWNKLKDIFIGISHYSPPILVVR